MALSHMNTDPAFFNEPIAETDGLRAAQAEELLAYLRGLRAAGGGRADVFRPRYESPAAYEASAAPLRAALESSIGYPPPGAARAGAPPVEAKVIGEDGLGTYERVRVPVLPGVTTAGLVLTPRGAAGPRPVVIAMHGGGGSPEVALFHGGQNYNDMVRGALARGYVVFAPTHLFRSAAHPPDVRTRADAMARLVGTTLAAVEVWKISRALDAVLARPGADRARVGMVGLSYGAYYTVLTMALDRRVRAGVAACYSRDEGNLWSLAGKELRHDYRWPHGGTLSDNASLLALACPRAVQLQHGLGDDLVPSGVSAGMAREAGVHYERLGVRDRLDLALFEGWHEFNGALAWPFLEKHL